MKKQILLFLSLIIFLLTGCNNNQVNVSWVSSDVQYNSESSLPDEPTTELVMKAWRGERIGAQALLTITDPVNNTLSVEAIMPSDQWACDLGWIREVITNDYNSCGSAPDTLAAYTVYDRIEVNSQLVPEKGKTYSLWCAVNVPESIEPGTYNIECNVKSGNDIVGTLTLAIDVLNKTLPEPKDYQFDLNLWQQPYSVSRYYKVEPWSDEHCELLKPYLRTLARAGQKTVSTILFYEPWGEQSNDKFEPMVATTLKKNGEWSYDYSAFDKWVELNAECGITKSIDCYSMVPWDMSFRYFDEATNEFKFLNAKTSDKAYEQLWTPFLKAFANHLKEKGWFEKTRIAMDERGLEDMLNAYKIAQKAVPGIKMSLAGVYHKELVDILDYYCLTYSQDFPAEELSLRKSRGQITTSYTCCADSYPSLFSNAAPVECEFIPLTCVARGFDGFLHWSWLNWTDNPMEDTRFKFFAPGDTYFYYPDNSPSIHWERFLYGIQQAEKVAMLKRYDLLDSWSDVDATNAESLASFVESVKAGVNQ